MPTDSPSSFPFKPSAAGTLGVEMEWMTVDAASGAQIPAAPHVFGITGNSPRIKPELFTSTVEINTSIHHETAACFEELAQLYRQTRDILAPLGADLLAAGTHPFSSWREQVVTEDPRYHRLLDRLQWMARRFNIFGMHVHIGMPDGDACIRVMNRLLPIMPVFLALSANSPFWNGEDTGLAASRIKVFEGLSQGGMPFYFSNWEDFEHCAGRLLATGSIDSVRDIWWEMRPHPDFGTLEVRIADMPASKSDAAACIAYIRAETMAALHGDPSDCRVHPSLIRENRWRACRYGMQMALIDPHTEALSPLLEWLSRRLDTLARHGASADDIAIVAGRLQCWREKGDGAMLQRRLRDSCSSFAEMVAAMRKQDGWHTCV